MPGKPKATISVSPNPTQWGSTLDVAAVVSNAPAEKLWFHTEAFQGDTLVYAQYAYVRADGSGTFSVGPTTAADESRPATSARAEIGYFARDGRYRAFAVASYGIEPA